MSLSEIFDNGAPHPWCNLRVNNLNLDNSIAINNNGFSITNGSIILRDASFQTVYIITIPPIVNCSFLIKFTTVFFVNSGIHAGDSFNQVTYTSFNNFNGVTSFNKDFVNPSAANPTGSITCLQNKIKVSNQILLQVSNSNSAEVTFVNWTAEIYSVITS
jgi:hypothetical protein